MNNNLQTKFAYRQRGVALAIALIILLILTILAVIGMRGSILELQMARNEEARISAFERAQSLVEFLSNNTQFMPVTGGIGFTNCLTNDTEGAPTCNSKTIELDDDLKDPAGFNRTTLRVTRIAPELSAAPRGIGASSDKFMAANFQIEATYDATDIKQGRAELVQGILVLVAVAQQK